MRKNDFNKVFREYSKNRLSPTASEQRLISSLYSSLQKLFGGSCIQIGSYPRFTAIRPVNDLDVLYIAGDYNPDQHDPKAILARLHKAIDEGFENPTSYGYSLDIQSHSVTIIFSDDRGQEVFSVDIVPGFTSADTNEFSDSLYYVPEILEVGHTKRAAYYQILAESHKEMGWIKSDPRGYIQEASQVNKDNADFRRTAKVIKAWKTGCSNIDDNFKLKSFHIEQIVMSYFKDDEAIEIFDALFKFFVELPDRIERPSIKDRADTNRYIDEYLAKVSEDEKKQIISAKDTFLKSLESFDADSSVDDLLNPESFFKRKVNEQFLFDFGIPTLTEPNLTLRIDGDVLKKEPGNFLRYLLSIRRGGVYRDRKIKFIITSNNTGADLYKWKVKNSDDLSDETMVRGEITDHHTRNDPESTEYMGDHFVECYAIKDNVCIAKARSDVVISNPM